MVQALESWRRLKSDERAKFDKKIKILAEDIVPQVSWGTSPEMVVGIDERIPDPASVHLRLKEKVCKMH